MITKLNDIPDEWWNLLDFVQVGHPKAVLAGGCFRDLVLGGEVKKAKANG